MLRHQTGQTGAELDGERFQQLLPGDGMFAAGDQLFVEDAFVRGVLIDEIQAAGAFGDQIGGGDLADGDSDECLRIFKSSWYERQGSAVKFYF